MISNVSWEQYSILWNILSVTFFAILDYIYWNYLTTNLWKKSYIKRIVSDSRTIFLRHESEDSSIKTNNKTKQKQTKKNQQQQEQQTNKTVNSKISVDSNFWFTS